MKNAFCLHLLFFVATFACVAATPVAAQYTEAGTNGFVTGDYTIASDFSGKDILVGKNASLQTLPGSFALTIAQGATTTVSNNINTGYPGVSTFGNHQTRITGGSVQYAFRYDASTISITGGMVALSIGYNTGTTTVSGGTVSQGVYSRDTGATNISGGTVTATTAFDNSTLNISGGAVFAAFGDNEGFVNITGGTTNRVGGYGASRLSVSDGNLTNGLLLATATTTANFVASNLSCTYTGYGNGNIYNEYADSFAVSGVFAGTPRTYTLYIQNSSGISGTPNAAPRQFTFNGLTPAIVPEAGTIPLVLSAFVLIGSAVIRRRAGSF